jgi:hypothetical protein
MSAPHAALAGRATIRRALMTAMVVAATGLSPAPAGGAVSVPARIDADGAVDVTAKLQRFVDSVPDRTTIRFPRGARYRVDGTLEWVGRRGLTLEGNGATLVGTAPGDAERAHIRLIDGGRWKIRNLRIRGANTGGGTFDPRYQWQHGVDLRGVDGVMLKRVSIADVYGDAVYIGLSTRSGRWSRDISIIRSRSLRSGRMAIAVTGGRRVEVIGGSWSEPGLSTFDIEPNGTAGGADRILIADTIVGPGSRHRALDITGVGPVSNITLRGNRFTGRPLHVRVDQASGRPQNIVIEDNVSSFPFAGSDAAMTFRNTDGVTVRDNRHVLYEGDPVTLVAAPESTRVAVSGQRVVYRRSPSSTLPLLAVGGTALALIVLVLWRRRPPFSLRAHRRQSTS